MEFLSTKPKHEVFSIILTLLKYELMNGNVMYAFKNEIYKLNPNHIIMSSVNQKQELARIKDRIKEDNIHILNLIGDKGIISQEEFKRIP